MKWHNRLTSTISIMLCVIMVLGSTTPAFAEDSGSKVPTSEGVQIPEATEQKPSEGTTNITTPQIEVTPTLETPKEEAPIKQEPPVEVAPDVKKEEKSDTLVFLSKEELNKVKDSIVSELKLDTATFDSVFSKFPSDINFVRVLSLLKISDFEKFIKASSGDDLLRVKELMTLCIYNYELELIAKKEVTLVDKKAISELVYYLFKDYKKPVVDENASIESLYQFYLSWFNLEPFEDGYKGFIASKEHTDVLLLKDIRGNIDRYVVMQPLEGATEIERYLSGLPLTILPNSKEVVTSTGNTSTPPTVVEDKVMEDVPIHESDVLSENMDNALREEGKLLDTPGYKGSKEVLNIPEGNGVQVSELAIGYEDKEKVFDLLPQTVPMTLINQEVQEVAVDWSCAEDSFLTDNKEVYKFNMELEGDYVYSDTFNDSLKTSGVKTPYASVKINNYSSRSAKITTPFVSSVTHKFEDRNNKFGIYFEIKTENLSANSFSMYMFSQWRKDGSEQPHEDAKIYTVNKKSNGLYTIFIPWENHEWALGLMDVEFTIDGEVGGKSGYHFVIQRPTMERCTNVLGTGGKSKLYAKLDWVYGDDVLNSFLKYCRIEMPTWSDNAGQDDLIWHAAKLGNYTVDGKSYNIMMDFNRADHKNEVGPYTVHTYLWINGAQIGTYALHSFGNVFFDMNGGDYNRGNTYPINYILNGGVNDNRNPTTYTKGYGVNFEAPIRTGYTFGGWCTDQALTQGYWNYIARTGTLNVYAKWNKINPSDVALTKSLLVNDNSVAAGSWIVYLRVESGNMSSLDSTLDVRLPTWTYHNDPGDQHNIRWWGMWNGTWNHENVEYNLAIVLNSDHYAGELGPYISHVYNFRNGVASSGLGHLNGNNLYNASSGVGYHTRVNCGDNCASWLCVRKEEYVEGRGTALVFPHGVGLIQSWCASCGGANVMDLHVIVWYASCPHTAYYDWWCSQEGWCSVGHGYAAGNINVAVPHGLQNHYVSFCKGHRLPNKYSLIYDRNEKPGGPKITGSMPAEVRNFDEQFPLRQNKFVNEGGKFLGWSFDKNATVPQFSAGQMVWGLVAEDIVEPGRTIYAVWQDTPPVVTVPETTLEVYEGVDFPRSNLVAGISITDAEDGDISKNVKIEKIEYGAGKMINDVAQPAYTYVAPNGDVPSTFKLDTWFEQLAKSQGTVNHKVYYSVADSSGNKVQFTRKVVVKYNNYPRISGKDRYFTLDEIKGTAPKSKSRMGRSSRAVRAVNGGMSYIDFVLNILNKEKIVVSDTEDDILYPGTLIPSIEDLNFSKSDYERLEGGSSVLVRVQVKDSMGPKGKGKVTKSSFMVSIIDDGEIKAPEDLGGIGSNDSFIRFINKDYYNKNRGVKVDPDSEAAKAYDNNGGLPLKSNWYRNPDYAAVAESTFNGSGVQETWEFKGTDVSNARGYVQTNGITGGFTSTFAANKK